MEGWEVSDDMLFEKCAKPEENESRKDFCLRLVRHCPIKIDFGDQKISADVYQVLGVGFAIGLFELNDPHENGTVISAKEIKRCAAVMTFKTRESIDIVREWLNYAERALESKGESNGDPE